MNLNSWSIFTPRQILEKDVFQYVGLVTSIMQSRVTKIVDDYISWTTEFQRSLADSIKFDAAGFKAQLCSSERKLNELITSNQAKIAKLDEELTKLMSTLALKDKAIADLEDDNYRLSQELDDLGQYTRRTNVRIYGVAEQPEETPIILASTSSNLNSMWMLLQMT
ncbi:hypothetical protein AWC38_SpisGene7790 [Stylophora pistillata]|uniref:Uncharacterized protein n=1 Tax=Stylophora pistillata TaxID=50429 RepID=A0A2B4SDS2_STYPI|nr:hypothetical protein AWC38_SpisGene7790 [Stylophora pistillata]